MAKILVVDDAPFMRLRLRNILKRVGHEVFEADDGTTGVEMYKQEKPELVFMDYSMKEMNGLDALKAIREFDAEANVVMLTGMGQQELVMSSIKLGAKNFIIKPFEEEKILQVANNIIG
jgi:two-component system, chemotaxis family, chemotaxis protein CheY